MNAYLSLWRLLGGQGVGLSSQTTIVYLVPNVETDTWQTRLPLNELTLKYQNVDTLHSPVGVCLSLCLKGHK